MDIIIERKKYRFSPQNYTWKHQNRPTSQFITCRIGGHDCFVKRQPTKFSGWPLIVKAISSSQIRNCPKVLSIARNNEHFYYFAEMLRGDILDSNHSRINGNGKEMMSRLFVAVYNINKLGFWYSDLCLKNIFLTDKGAYHLIDVDSSFPHNKKFHFDLDVNYDYAALLVKFGSETGYGRCNLVKGHSGECMNQAMLVALAMDIRHAFRIPLQKKDSVIHGMLLKWHEKDYIQLFKKLLKGKADWVGTRKLVDKIFEKNMNPGPPSNKKKKRLKALMLMMLSVSRSFLQSPQEAQLRW